MYTHTGECPGIFKGGDETFFVHGGGRVLEMNESSAFYTKHMCIML